MLKILRIRLQLIAYDLIYRYLFKFNLFILFFNDKEMNHGKF